MPLLQPNKNVAYYPMYNFHNCINYSVCKAIICSNKPLCKAWSSFISNYCFHVLRDSDEPRNCTPKGQMRHCVCCFVCFWVCGTLNFLFWFITAPIFFFFCILVSFANSAAAVIPVIGYFYVFGQMPPPGL